MKFSKINNWLWFFLNGGCVKKKKKEEEEEVGSMQK